MRVSALHINLPVYVGAQAAVSFVAGSMFDASSAPEAAGATEPPTPSPKNSQRNDGTSVARCSLHFFVNPLGIIKGEE